MSVRKANRYDGDQLYTVPMFPGQMERMFTITNDAMACNVPTTLDIAHVWLRRGISRSYRI
eukprot:12839752-Ditylum_brightwellii.AAC.1